MRGICARRRRVMKSARYGLILPAMGLFLMLGSQGFAQSQREDNSVGNTGSGTAMARDDQRLPLSQVPQPARETARKALVTMPAEAAMVAGTNPQQYQFIGTDRSGNAVSIHVLQDGKMVKKEKER